MLGSGDLWRNDKGRSLPNRNQQSGREMGMERNNINTVAGGIQRLFKGGNHPGF